MLKTKKLESVAFILLAGYIWILPIAHTTTIREFFFFSLLSLTLLSAWRREISFRMPMLIPWIIYGIVSIFSLSYAIDLIYSLKEIKAEIGYSIIIMMLAATWIRDQFSFSKMVWVLIIGNIFLVCSALIKGLYVVITSYNINIATTPFDIGVGKFSSYIIIVIPFILVQTLIALKNNRRSAFLLFLLLIANIIALYFTYNRAAWIALFVQIISLVCLLSYFRIIHSMRKIIFSITFCLLFVIIIFSIITFIQRSGDPIDKNIFNVYDVLILKTQKLLSEDPRLEFWKVALKNIKDKPLYGGGFGREAFKLLNPEYSKSKSFAWHAHNVFLNKGVQMGIPGILSFCLLFIVALYKIWTIEDNNFSVFYKIAGIVMILGVLMKNMTDDFFIRDNAWLFWLIISGIISAFGKHEKEVKNK